MYDGPGIPENHPEFLAMEAAICCQMARSAAVDAAAKGEPALAGLDQMLTETFARYRDKNHNSLKNAGFIIARLMRDQLNYSQGEVVNCPEGCTASKGTMFYPPNSN